MTEEQYRPIRESLLAAACIEISPQLADATQRANYWPDPKDKAEIDVPPQLVQTISSYLQDADPFCDHSVGICQCSLIYVIQDLNSWLDGYSTCTQCYPDFMPGKVLARVEHRVWSDGTEYEEEIWENCPGCLNSERPGYVRLAH